MNDVLSAVQPVDWAAIGPPLAVASTAIVVLVLDGFLPARRRSVTVGTALLGLLVGLALMLPLQGASRGVFCLDEAGAACSYVVDDVTLVFWLVAAGGAIVVVLLSTVRGAGLPGGEYHFFVLASATGAMTIAAARDLITLVVALELVTLPAIALVGLRRGSGRAAEAALKFFLVSVVSVAVMLFGIALVYGATGAVQVDRVGRILAAGEADVPRNVATVGVLLTLVGLAFKVGSVPFHFWVPETYAGAPVPVAAYLSVVSKAAGLVGLLIVVSKAFATYASVWSPAVAALAVLSMTLGNLVALRQDDAVRLLAWSSIAHAGYLLVPLGAVRGQTLDRGLLTATIAYLLIYAVINLGAFAVVAVVARGAEGSRLADYRGLFWRHRASALLLAFFLLALAGLPPGVAGLIGKVVLFRAAVEGGATWLGVVMAVNIVIGLAYYLRWTASLFAPPEEAGEEAVPAERPRRTPVTAGVAWGITGALTVLLSVAPNLALDVLRVVQL